MADASAVASPPAASPLNAKIKALIDAMAADKDKPVCSFNRILLKFPAMRRTLSTVKGIFDAADKDGNGTVEHDELGSILASLGSKITEKELADAFDTADLFDDGKLTFKEFLVCLAIGSLLGTIPFTKSGAAASAQVGAEGDGAEAGGLRTVGEAHTSLSDSDVTESLKDKDGRALMQTFHLCLEAYATFDRSHSGCINKDELEAAMTELATVGASHSMGARRTHPVPTAALHFLSEERFAELDFDKDGSATFAEFLFAMFTWVGIDEDDEDEVEEQKVEVDEA